MNTTTQPTAYQLTNTHYHKDEGYTVSYFFLPTPKMIRITKVCEEHGNPAKITHSRCFSPARSRRCWKTLIKRGYTRNDLYFPSL